MTKGVLYPQEKKSQGDSIYVTLDNNDYSYRNVERSRKRTCVKCLVLWAVVIGLVVLSSVLLVKGLWFGWRLNDTLKESSTDGVLKNGASNQQIIEEVTSKSSIADTRTVSNDGGFEENADFNGKLEITSKEMDDFEESFLPTTDDPSKLIAAVLEMGNKDPTVEEEADTSDEDEEISFVTVSPNFLEDGRQTNTDSFGIYPTESPSDWRHDTGDADIDDSFELRNEVSTMSEEVDEDKMQNPFANDDRQSEVDDDDEFADSSRSQLKSNDSTEQVDVLLNLPEVTTKGIVQEEKDSSDDSQAIGEIQGTSFGNFESNNIDTTARDQNGSELDETDNSEDDWNEDEQETGDLIPSFTDYGTSPSFEYPEDDAN